jgi:hypothetical protein
MDLITSYENEFHSEADINLLSEKWRELKKVCDELFYNF